MSCSPYLIGNISNELLGFEVPLTVNPKSCQNDEFEDFNTITIASM